MDMNFSEANLDDSSEQRMMTDYSEGDRVSFLLTSKEKYKGIFGQTIRKIK